jgi:hypothetical protein
MRLVLREAAAVALKLHSTGVCCGYGCGCVGAGGWLGLVLVCVCVCAGVGEGVCVGGGGGGGGGWVCGVWVCSSHQLGAFRNPPPTPPPPPLHSQRWTGGIKVSKLPPLLLLLYMCPHANYYYICVLLHTNTIYVSSFCYYIIYTQRWTGV